MKNILYSNICNSSLEELKQEYIDSHDLNEKDIKDIPESDIYHFWEACNEDWYEEFKYNMKVNMNNKKYIILGTLGLWDGKREVAAIEKGFDAILKCVYDSDYVEIFEEDEKLIIQTHHHDGTNMFEIKELTFSGFNIVENNFSKDYSFIKKIFNNDLHSRFPSFIKQLAF